MDDSVLVSIRLRNDLAANWAASTLLAEGEVGVETDTSRMKIGDGIRTWSELPYVDAPLASVAPPSIGAQSARGTSTSAARADHSHGLPETASFKSLSVTGSQTVGGSLAVTGDLVGGTHTHELSDVSGLSDALSAKSATSHSHDVRTLQHFPSMQGNSGKYLASDGTDLYWSAVSSGAADITDGTGIKVGVNFSGETVISLADSAVNRIYAVDTSDGATATLTGNITLQSGSNVDLDVSGSTITISSTATSSGNVAGVSTVNSISGNVSIAGATGGGITVTESGQKVLLSAAIPSAATTVEALSAVSAVGTSGSYARADHKHPLPNVNNLAISADLDYSNYNVKHASSYTSVSTAPTSSTVPGLFALVDGVPRYSSGSDWLELSRVSHNHSISQVSGLSTALSTIPQSGTYVTSVNGQSPDSSGAVTIQVGDTSVSWSEINDRPTKLSSFVNDGNGLGTGAFVNASGAAAAAPVQSVAGRTGTVTIAHADVGGFKDGVFGSLQGGTGIVVTQDPTSSKSVITVDSEYYTGETPTTPPTDTTTPGGTTEVLGVTQFPGAEFDASPFYGSQATLEYKASSPSVSVTWFMRATTETAGQVDWQPVSTSTLVQTANWIETDNGDGSGTLSFDVSDDMHDVEVKCRFDGSAQGLGFVESGVTRIVVHSLSAQTTGTLSKTVYSDSTVPAGTAVVVVKNAVGPRTLFRWQVGRAATAAELADPYIGTYLNRGPLYQNVMLGVSSTEQYASDGSSELRIGSPPIDVSSVNTVERQFGTDGSVYRVMSLRAIIEDAVDSFTLQPSSESRRVYSAPITITVLDRPPAFTSHPQDGNVQQGEVQFTAVLDADYPIEWRLGGVTIPARLSPSVVRSESGGVVTEVITLTGVLASDIGKSIVAHAMVVGQSVASSQSARITGSRPSVVSLVSDIVNPYVENQTVQLTATLRLEPGTYTYEWVTRESSGQGKLAISQSEELTVQASGTVELAFQDSIALSSSVDYYSAPAGNGSRLYAIHVAEGSIAEGAIADSSKVVASPDVSVTSIPASVTNVSLGNKVVEPGNYFSGFTHTGSLLTASIPHYAIVRLSELDSSFSATGIVSYQRTQNGTNVPEYGPPREFGITGGDSSYQFGATTPSSALQVDLLVNTSVDEVDIDTASKTIVAPPWLIETSMGSSPFSLEDFPDQTITLYEARQRFPVPSTYSGGITESWTLRAGFPGWAVAASGRIVLGLTSRVSVGSLRAEDIPRHSSLSSTEPIGYSWKWQGIARDDDVVLAWPKLGEWPNAHAQWQIDRNIGALPVPWPSAYLISEDEGATWAWVKPPASTIGVADIQVFNGKFLGIFFSSGSTVCLESSDGKSWSAPSAPNLAQVTFMSVANGYLFAYTSSNKYGYVYNSSGQIVHQEYHAYLYHAGVRYVGGQYINGSLRYANSYAGPWKYMSSVGSQMGEFSQATPVSIGSNSYTLGFSNLYGDHTNSAFFMANAGEVVDEDGAAPGLIVTGMDNRIALHKQLVVNGSKEILGICWIDDGRFYGVDVATYIWCETCLGPQVGKYIYAGVGRSADPGQAGGSSEILKIYADDPTKTRFIPPVSDQGFVGPHRVTLACAIRVGGGTLTNYPYTNDFRVGDPDYESPAITVHSYRYGPDEEDDAAFPGVTPTSGTVQLSSNYLNGTDTPCYGDRSLIFTRNRVIRLYCPMAPPNSRWYGESGESGDTSYETNPDKAFEYLSQPPDSGDGWWNYFPILR